MMILRIGLIMCWSAPLVLAIPMTAAIAQDARADRTAHMVQFGIISADDAIERIRATLKNNKTTYPDHKPAASTPATSVQISPGAEPASVSGTQVALTSEMLKAPVPRPGALRAAVSRPSLVSRSIIHRADQAALDISKVFIRHVRNTARRRPALPDGSRPFRLTRVKPVMVGFKHNALAHRVSGLPDLQTASLSGRLFSLKPRGGTLNARRRTYLPVIRRYARAYGIPVKLADTVVRVESSYNPRAKGKDGEVGLMQVLPATARQIGYRGSWRGLFNPVTNIKYGMLYLSKAYKLARGNVCGTAMRYNGGLARTTSNRMTRRYCQRIMAHMTGQ